MRASLLSLLGCLGDFVSRLCDGPIWGLLWDIMRAYRGHYLDFLSQPIIRVWPFNQAHAHMQLPLTSLTTTKSPMWKREYSGKPTKIRL